MLAALERASCLPPCHPGRLAGFCHTDPTRLKLIWARGEERRNTMATGMKSNEDDTQETHPYQGTTLYQRGAEKNGKSLL